MCVFGKTHKVEIIYFFLFKGPSVSFVCPTRPKTPEHVRTCVFVRFWVNRRFSVIYRARGRRKNKTGDPSDSTTERTKRNWQIFTGKNRKKKSRFVRSGPIGCTAKLRKSYRDTMCFMRIQKPERVWQRVGFEQCPAGYTSKGNENGRLSYGKRRNERWIIAKGSAKRIR